MYCRQVVRRLLRQCGRKVTAQLPEGEISLTAYLNPLRERDDRLGFGESGMVQQGRWLLLAPWEEGEALSVKLLRGYFTETEYRYENGGNDLTVTL